jgi:hypothetical protein
MNPPCSRIFLLILWACLRTLGLLLLCWFCASCSSWPSLSLGATVGPVSGINVRFGMLGVAESNAIRLNPVTLPK